MKTIITIAALFCLGLMSASAADCPCGADCKCQLGNCPEKCPVNRTGIDSPAYKKACADVQAGKTIYLAVNIPGVTGQPSVTLKGITPGMYRCYKDAKGKAVMSPGNFQRVCHGTYCTMEWKDHRAHHRTGISFLVPFGTVERRRESGAD